MLVQVTADVYIDPADVEAIAPAPMSGRNECTYVYMRSGQTVYVQRLSPTVTRQRLGMISTGRARREQELRKDGR
jgi:hypothetical protein